MPRVKTLSFVAEFPLQTTAADEKTLDTRLNAARHLYNACLQESLRRLDLMKQSKAWQAARAMPSTVDKRHNKARSQAFGAELERFAFTSREIEKHALSCRNACWIGDHLGSHDTQTTSLRAFRAAEQYAFGKRGRPRFKSLNRLNSIEGKADAVIRYRDEPVPAVHYSGLVLPLMLDPKDKRDWQREALAGQDQVCPHYPARDQGPRPLVLPVGARGLAARYAHQQGRYCRTRHRAVQHRGGIKRRRYFGAVMPERRRTVERLPAYPARDGPLATCNQPGQLRCQRARDQG